MKGRLSRAWSRQAKVALEDSLVSEKVDIQSKKSVSYLRDTSITTEQWTEHYWWNLYQSLGVGF